MASGNRLIPKAHSTSHMTFIIRFGQIEQKNLLSIRNIFEKKSRRRKFVIFTGLKGESLTKRF